MRGDEIMNFSRRFLIYFILFFTLNVYAFGFSNLIGWVFDLAGIIGSVETQNIAPFIAAIIVCLPIWIFSWRFANRIAKNIAEEKASRIRNLYLNLVRFYKHLIPQHKFFFYLMHQSKLHHQRYLLEQH